MMQNLAIDENESSNINNLSKVLNLLLIEKNLKPVELARRTHVPQPTIQRLVSGTTSRPHLSSLAPIAKYFLININQLMGLEPIPWLHAAPHQSQQVRNIPILAWNEVESCLNEPDRISTLSKNNFIISDAKVSENAYALTVKDSSMEPVFSIGTQIIVDPLKEPKDRCFVVVKLAKNKEAVLRQLIIDGINYFIKPLSLDLSHFKMQKIELCDTLCGVLVQAKRNFDSFE